MDLASIFKDVLGAEAGLWFQVGLRKDDSIHIHISHFLSLNEKKSIRRGKAEAGRHGFELLHEDSGSLPP